MTDVHPPPPVQRPQLNVWGLVVTYERPDALATMLDAIAQQSRPPDHLLIVDNGLRYPAREVARAHGCDYLALGENTGPAGGIAEGMTEILRHAGDDDWLALFDDDDPPPFEDLLAQLVEFGQVMVGTDPRTAAVGALGARYDRARGTWVRLTDDELDGPVGVDVIHGGRFPLYRCGVLREVGVFDPDLFFGFEEGDFGLRLRQAGYRLYLKGALAQRLRVALGEDGLRGPRRTPLSKAAWRRYYGVRNSTILARRYAAPWTPPIIALGGAAKGTLALVRTRRPVRECLLPVAGAVAGLRGRTGRTINPASSTK